MVQLLQRVAALLLAAAALVQATNPLVPASGAFIGVSIDWNEWKSVNDYSLYAQINPASYTVYINLPLNAQDKGLLDNVVPQIAVKGALAIIVAQPTAGLAAMTDAVATSFAKVLNGYEQQGAIMMIEFGHEMNGNWYNWGQQPTEYVAAFQRMTNAIRQYTCRTFMLWAPNNGGGYPFPNGTAIADYVSTTDFKAMDTNGDGQITQTDDPYAPFYPGDDYVDWVGCSIYHFGTSFPYGANVVPLPRTFTSTIFGTFVSASVDYRGIPNFYEVYSGSNSTHGKPMCVPETSALYNENQAGQGASELSIKSTWWQQLYNVNGDTTNALDISVAMPNLKLISWFDQNKTEATASNDLIDWTFTNNKAVHQGWLAETAATPSNGTGSKYWLFLSDWITLTNKASSGSTGGLITESVSDFTIQSTAAYSSVPNCLRQGTSSSGDSLAQYGAAAPSIHGTAAIAMLLSIAAVVAAHMLF